jgi:hypothetical protein
MYKRLALLLATLVVGSLGALAVTAPASAAPNPCPAKFICWYDRSDWTSYNYIVNPLITAPNTCFNMGTDPNGVNWDSIVDSVWWNQGNAAPAYAEFYEGLNCTIAPVTRAHAFGYISDQMQSCTEAAIYWNGPCAPPSYVIHRIRSWAFSWS